MLPSNQKLITEQAKFTYSPLGKAFKKQTKTIKGQGERQVDALKPLESSDKQLSSVKDFISKEKLNPEIINELKRTEEEEKEDDRSKIIYKGYNKTYDFRKFKTLRVFGNNIRNNFININIANDEWNHLAKYIKEFESEARPQDSNSKKVKEVVLNSAMVLLQGREMVSKTFENGLFSWLK